MPSNNSGKDLASDLGNLKITNVRTQQNGTTNGDLSTVWQDPTSKCVLCWTDIPKYKLKEHILTHFTFYRPYKCKNCDVKFGDIDVYLTEHLMKTGHKEGCDVIGQKLPAFERLVDLLWTHCRRLTLDDYDNVIEHLQEIKTAASNFGKVSAAQAPQEGRSYSTRLRSGKSTNANESLESLSNATPRKQAKVSSSDNTAASAESTTKRKENENLPTAKRRRSAAAKDPNRKMAIFFKCKLCDSNVHKAERNDHVKKFHNKNMAAKQNSNVWKSCFENAEQKEMTDDEASEEGDEENTVAAFQDEGLEDEEQSNEESNNNETTDSDESYSPNSRKSSNSSTASGKQQHHGRRRRGRPSTRASSSSKSNNDKGGTSSKTSSSAARSASPDTTSTVSKTSEKVVEEKNQKKGPPTTMTTAKEVSSTPMAPLLNNLDDVATPDDNVSNSSSTPHEPSHPFTLLCDHCQQVLPNQDALKAHCLERHVGGFCPFYCNGCKFQVPNQRSVIDHCRSVCKNPKLMTRNVPTDEQKGLLVALREGLAKKGITLDTTRYFKD